MQFLSGGALTKALRNLAQSDGQLKIAVAYWGDAALDLLGLDAKKRNLEVICCLNGGTSSPKVIGKFGSRARQNDKLHAKIIWTEFAAIVGSANFSSNGLPEEEKNAVGLIEAGVLLDDASQLEKIRSWFETEYKKARRIYKDDLKRAQKAREDRIKGGPRSNIVRELVDIPLSDIAEAKVAVLIWSVETTPELDAEVERREFPESKINMMNWYIDSKKHAEDYPPGFNCLVFHATSLYPPKLGRTKPHCQMIPEQKDWNKVSGGYVVWALDQPTLSGIGPYVLGPKSVKEIRTRLQKRGLRLQHHLESGDPEDGFLGWEPLDKLLST